MHKLNWLSHVLRAPDDGTGGGGGVTPPNDPPNGQAQGQDPNPLIGQLSSLIEEKLGSFKDSMHADIRRQIDGMSNRGKGSGSKPTPDPTPPQPQPDPTPGLTREDIRSVVASERAIQSAMASAGLSEGARGRMLRAFEAESPKDPAAWAKEYLSDFGLGDKTEGATGTPAPTTAQGAAVTNTGAPAQPTTVNEDTPLWRLSESDRAALIAQKGRHWFRQKYREQLKNTKVQVRNF